MCFGPVALRNRAFLLRPSYVSSSTILFLYKIGALGIVGENSLYMTPPQIRLVERFVNLLLVFDKPVGLEIGDGESSLVSQELATIQTELGMNGYQILVLRNEWMRKNEEAAAERQAVFAHLLQFGVDDSCGSGAM